MDVANIDLHRTALIFGINPIHKKTAPRNKSKFRMEQAISMYFNNYSIYVGILSGIKRWHSNL